MSILCDCSDAYIHDKGNIAIANAGRDANPDNRNKKVTFKNCAPFTNYISEVDNTQVDNAHDIDLVMPMHQEVYDDTIEMNQF